MGRKTFIVKTYKIVKIDITTFSFVTKGTIFLIFLHRSNVLFFDQIKKESLCFVSKTLL